MKTSFCTLTRNLILGLTLLGSSAHAELVLTMGGDLNLNTSKAKPHPQGGFKWGQLRNYDQALSGLKPLIDGDLNFANIETVISERQDLTAVPTATYPFVMHPNGLHAVLRAGFNLLSLSNNHTGDFGQLGMLETEAHLRRIQNQNRNLGWHGVGLNQNEATTPWVQDVRTASGQTYRIAFGAITGSMNWDFAARANRPGIVGMYDRRAVNTLLQRMKNAEVDLRILSVHFGKEKFLEVESTARDLYRGFVQNGNIDVIIGHHPHRVRPIERVSRTTQGEQDDAVIFYSLGNLQMFGAASLNELGIGHDYGLWAKVFLNWNSRVGKLVVQGIQATALTDMHTQARPMKGADGKKRLEYLSQLSRKQFPNSGVQLQIKPRGDGVSCWGQDWGLKAQQACQD